jgi:hypothetical protein
VHARPLWDARSSSRSPSTSNAAMTSYASPTAASAASAAAVSNPSPWARRQSPRGAVERPQVGTTDGTPRVASTPRLPSRRGASSSNASRSSSPTANVAAAAGPTAAVAPPAAVPAEVGAWYAPPTAGGLCFGGSVFRAVTTSHAPSAGPPPALPIESLPQLTSVLVTGAELFALLRLRGVIQTTMPLAAGEDRLPAAAVHQMLVTAFELEQLHALRRALGEPADPVNVAQSRLRACTASYNHNVAPEAAALVAPPPISTRTPSHDRGRSGSRASSAASSGEHSARPAPGPKKWR